MVDLLPMSNVPFIAPPELTKSEPNRGTNRSGSTHNLNNNNNDINININTNNNNNNINMNVQGEQVNVLSDEQKGAISESVVNALLSSSKNSKPAKLLGFTKANGEGLNLVLKSGSIPKNKKRGINSTLFSRATDHIPSTLTTKRSNPEFLNNNHEKVIGTDTKNGQGNSLASYNEFPNSSITGSDLSDFIQNQYEKIIVSTTATAQIVEHKDNDDNTKGISDELNVNFLPIYSEMERTKINNEIRSGDIPNYIFDSLRFFENDSSNPVQASESCYQLTQNLLEWLINNKDVAHKYLPTLKTCIKTSYCKLHEYTRRKAEYEHDNAMANVYINQPHNGNIVNHPSASQESTQRTTSNLSKRITFMEDHISSLQNEPEEESMEDSDEIQFYGSPNSKQYMTSFDKSKEEKSRDSKYYKNEINALIESLNDKDKIIDAMDKQIESLTEKTDSLKKEVSILQEHIGELTKVIEKERDKRKVCVVCDNKINNVSTTIYTSLVEKITILEQLTNEMLTFTELKAITTTYSNTLKSISDSVAKWEDTLGLGPNFRERFSYEFGVRMESFRGILPENYVPRDTFTDLCRIVKKMKTAPKIIYLKNIITELAAREKDIEDIKTHINELSKKVDDYLKFSVNLSDFYNNPYGPRKTKNKNDNDNDESSDTDDSSRDDLTDNNNDNNNSNNNNSKLGKNSHINYNRDIRFQSHTNELQASGKISVNIDVMLPEYNKGFIVDESIQYTSMYSFLGYCQYKNICKYHNMGSLEDPQKLFIKWATKIGLKENQISIIYHSWCSSTFPAIRYLFTFLTGMNSITGFMFYVWCSTWIKGGLLDITNSWVELVELRPNKISDYKKIYVSQIKVKQMIDLFFPNRAKENEMGSAMGTRGGESGNVQTVNGIVNQLDGSNNNNINSSNNYSTGNSNMTYAKPSLVVDSKVIGMIENKLDFRKQDPLTIPKSGNSDYPPVEILSLCQALTELYIVAIKERIENGRAVYSRFLVSLQENIKKNKNTFLSAAGIYDAIKHVILSVSPKTSNHTIFDIFKDIMSSGKNIPSWQSIVSSFDKHCILFPKDKLTCQSGPAIRIAEIPYSDARFIAIIKACKKIISDIISTEYISQWNPILVRKLNKYSIKLDWISKKSSYSEVFQEFYYIIIKMYTLIHRGVWLGLDKSDFIKKRSSAIKEMIVKDMEIMATMLESVAIKF